MTIKILEDDIINRISAGEVVERPSSVVRELVDNSIDAGATEISIFLEQGGSSLIRVNDNGCGMSLEDAVLAFERHATSKISTATDLETISTLGFRGEALPSIAAVSQVRIKTRRPSDELAVELRMEGGKMLPHSQTSANVGTDIIVRNLFFNTPARRKFLKTERTEAQRVKNWVLNSSIGHPSVHFKLYIDGKEILNLARKPSSFHRAQTIFDGSSVEIKSQAGPFSADGLVSHPSLAQHDSSLLVLLVNGRVVSDRMLARAVKDGFDSTLKHKEFPVGFLSLRVPPQEVDVNVHPQKSEVRFAHPKEVFVFIRNAVSASVRQFKGPVPEYQNTGLMRHMPNQASSIVNKEKSLFARNLALRYGEPSALDTEHSQEFMGEVDYTQLRFVGQIMKCYLLFEGQDELIVVDMHAAHERINVNRIRESFFSHGISSQTLLVPVSVELFESGVVNIIEHSSLLKKFGFEMEESGLCSIVVRGAPSFIAHEQIAEVIKEIAVLELDVEAQGKLKEVADMVSARIACHASVRAGDSLGAEEAYSLLRSLQDAELANACPHGRPVVISHCKTTIEKWFGRDR